MTTIDAEIPDPLWQQARLMIEQGCARDEETLIAEALRRYVESHQDALNERFIREDVDWGLRGND